MFDDIQERLNARVPDIHYEQRFGLIARLRQYILERRANAMLKRTLGVPKVTPSHQLPPHLLKDIGLPPDMHL
jgi:hypothetical protein